MTYDNMLGADKQFTKMMSWPGAYWLGYLLLPIYFLWAGTGYKLIVNDEIVACAFLHLRSISGYIFNVHVNKKERGQGFGQILMNEVEQIIVAEQLNWSVLQVDRENIPAQKLYLKNHYLFFNPYFWQGTLPPPAHTIESSFQFNQLSTTKGISSYRTSLFNELAAEKQVDISLIAQEYFPALPEGAHHFSCLYENKSIGHLTIIFKPTPVILMNLKEDWWGNPQVVPLLQQFLIDQQINPHTKINLFLGSTTHFERIGTVLIGLNFIRQMQSQAIMIKKLGNKPLTSFGKKRSN